MPYKGVPLERRVRKCLFGVLTHPVACTLRWAICWAWMNAHKNSGGQLWQNLKENQPWVWTHYPAVNTSLRGCRMLSSPCTGPCVYCPGHMWKHVPGPKEAKGNRYLPLPLEAAEPENRCTCSGCLRVVLRLVPVRITRGMPRDGILIQLDYTISVSGQFCSPGQHVSMSGDVLGCQNQEGLCYWHLASRGERCH